MGYHIDTILVHAEGAARKHQRATAIPIYQSTAFKYENCKEISDVFSGKGFGHVYTRISNPTVSYLEARLNALEEGLAAIATASGMAAITVAILTLAKKGHHIVSSNSLFGGTYSFFNKTIRELGVDTTFVDPRDTAALKKAVKKNTKAIFIETIGNPKMDVPDIKAISKIAEKEDVPLIVDSTLTTPYLVKPKDLGANIVIHSTSKFINGHGNSIGGAIIDCGNFDWASGRFTHFGDFNKKYGGLAFLAKARSEVFRDFGGCLSPFNAFLISLGLETLSLRMEKHCNNALELAEFLEAYPKVKAVNYPGLKSNAFYALTQKQFKGRGGALLTFALANKKECFKVIDSLKLAYNLANLGDARTLVIHPASTICVEFSPAERTAMGAADNLVRVAVGIEYAKDIINDFKQALEKI